MDHLQRSTFSEPMTQRKMQRSKRLEMIDKRDTKLSLDAVYFISEAGLNSSVLNWTFADTFHVLPVLAESFHLSSRVIVSLAALDAVRGALFVGADFIV